MKHEEDASLKKGNFLSARGWCTQMSLGHKPQSPVGQFVRLTGSQRGSRAGTGLQQEVFSNILMVYETIILPRRVEFLESPGAFNGSVTSVRTASL